MTLQHDFEKQPLEVIAGLSCRRSSPTGDPKGRLILMHGVGSNESNLIGLAASLPIELEILLLRGPLQMGPSSFGWYQVEFNSNGPSFNLEQAESSRKLLSSFIKALPELPTVIAGFSQGGIMSASLGLSEPELIVGFAILSGRILREIAPSIAPFERLRGISAFIAHGHNDPVLSVKWAHEASLWLDRLGISHETHLYNMEHEINYEELRDFACWLDNIFMNRGRRSLLEV